MIESFAQLEQIGKDRDLAEVFLEVDEQEHAIPREQILEALSKRRQVMRDCIDRGKGGALHSASAFFSKHPPVQMTDDEAYRSVEEFISGERES